VVDRHPILVGRGRVVRDRVVNDRVVRLIVRPAVAHGAPTMLAILTSGVPIAIPVGHRIVRHATVRHATGNNRTAHNVTATKNIVRSVSLVSLGHPGPGHTTNIARQSTRGPSIVRDLASKLSWRT
jgi:hypothetical protein